MKNITIIILLAIIGLCSSCEKFLEAKPNQKLAVPATAHDLRLMLDTYSIINNGMPITVETMSDNYYVTNTDLSGLANQLMRNLYTWQRDETANSEWTNVYKSIYYTNVVLDEWKKLGLEGGQEAAAVKGSAMALQAFYYYMLAQLFAVPYQASADAPWGLSLRYDADFSKAITRASVHETYNTIIQLLKQSLPLLPAQEPLKTRPTKAMAYGLLARTYLLTKNYAQAQLYADSALLYNNRLINFNTLNANANAPFARFNGEVVFHARTSTTPILSPAIAKIDSNLYRSYDKDDLRKTMYFKLNANGTVSFKGDYDGSGTSSGYVFWGLVTDELYLIRAECLARQGMYVLAMETLNYLLITRWKSGSFIALSAANAEDALNIILRERRKELLFRGTRWSDLRRLRDEPQVVEPVRVVNGDTIRLMSNSNKYTLPIPYTIINQSEMAQNPL
ncbi:RagB/SusD family nutrient uptake outer membrane protein [Pedobacter namyangjuensis]|uniref:RagB/SusD family nutrient uptake outer membrane protein n=1 Tax=Pedobacter namyangjuensis TaxID=600626 RepID=UPI0013B46169|nr:RagB/SusD family nutrient uptake outer membrane protein [Pedobacter namyangjuensis]